MELGLIKPRAHLDYLPPKARILTSTCDQPSKTKFYKPVIHCTKETYNASMVPRKDNTSNTPSTHNMTNRQPISYKTGSHHGTIFRCI